MKQIKIALVGCGTVGSAVVRLIHEQKRAIEKRHKVSLELVKIYTRNPNSEKCRDIYESSPELFVSGLDSILSDTSIDIVVETVGGTDFAETVARKSLMRGKDLVTANKSLLNERWSQYLRLAIWTERSIGYSAAVAGAIPITDVLQGSLAGAQVYEIRGILNGTSNYILNEMENRGISLSEALKEAQDLGYAEADPTEDISGVDARNKLSILLRGVFGFSFAPDAIYTQGIEDIIPEDFEYAREKLKSTIRLVAASTEWGAAFVCPMFIQEGDFLANIPAQLNGVKVLGESFGELGFIGPGAGGSETASAILGDVVNIAKGTAANDELNISKELGLYPFEDVVFQHTLRFVVKDRPGIIRDISAVLAEGNISIKAVEQNEYSKAKDSELPFLITLHPVLEKKVQKALEKINEFDFMVKPAVVFRSFAN